MCALHFTHHTPHHTPVRRTYTSTHTYPLLYCVNAHSLHAACVVSCPLLSSVSLGRAVSLAHSLTHTGGAGCPGWSVEVERKFVSTVVYKINSKGNGVCNNEKASACVCVCERVCVCVSLWGSALCVGSVRWVFVRWCCSLQRSRF